MRVVAPVGTGARERHRARCRARSPRPLTEVTGFGSNPGALKMFEYVPAGLAAGAPLVLVLHGCTESAANAATTGWNELADQAKFAVVYPEQQTANNPVQVLQLGRRVRRPVEHPARQGREPLDQADGRQGRRRARLRSEARLRGGLLGGRRYGGDHGGDVPGRLRRRRDARGHPVRLHDDLLRGQRLHEAGQDEERRRLGRAREGRRPRLRGPVAAHVDLAGQRRHHGRPRQSHGAREAVGRRPRRRCREPRHRHRRWPIACILQGFDRQGRRRDLRDRRAWPTPFPSSPGAGCGTASAYAIDKGICSAGRIASFFGISTAGAPGPADAGADAKAPGSSSGASRRRRAPAASPPKEAARRRQRGRGAPVRGTEGSAGSTCSVARSAPGRSSSAPLALLASLLTLTVAVARTRSRSRSSKAVVR